ncbi:MAG: hypothetical protein AAFX06_27450 [Planctomycetota bacterium]
MKHCFTVALVLSCLLIAVDSQADPALGPSAKPENDASKLVDQVLDRLANGQPFEAKVRQRVWASGREVVGVGHLTQAASGTGAFKMSLTIHDGNGKHSPHSFEQVSDGRLAYTRTVIGGTVSLKRVDVGWLDEGLRTLRRNDRVRPSMKVGGICEMIDTLRRDYDLRVGTSELDGRSLYVLIGRLKENRIAAIKQESNRDLPELFPRRVHVFITAEDDPRTGVQRGVPIRIEHRGAPPSTGGEQAASSKTNPGGLISLLELYSIQPTSPPRIQQFRFENQDASVTFENETGRYEDRFDIRVSAKQRERFR